jgi:hypothetical protein
MRRREFIALMGASFAWPFPATAQKAGRTYRLGILGRYPPFDPTHRGGPVAMLDALRQRGFIEGKNLTLVVRDFGLRRELMSEYAAELVKAQVDVIYVVGLRPFELLSKRPKRFHSSRLLTIWSVRLWFRRSPIQTATRPASAS